MPLVEQKIDAMLLQLNGIGIRIGDALDDLDPTHMNFIAARRARFGLNLPRHDHARFLRESFQRAESHRLFFERNYTLDDSRAVAKNWKEELARFSQVIKPTADGDGLP